MMTRIRLVTMLLLAAITPWHAGAAIRPYLAPPAQLCFADAGSRYQIDSLLLEAIARQESGLNPAAINDKNRNGSIDYGVMQINSRHIPGLKKEGLIRDHRDLLNRPCLNIQIGARLLASHFQHCGINWNCLGSYNAGFAKRNHTIREKYANLVWAKYRQLLRERRGVILK